MTAIVVVENIVLHRDGGEGPLEATHSALKELTVPLIGSTLTPIVVFLPLISITGVTGTFLSRSRRGHERFVVGVRWCLLLVGPRIWAPT